MLQDGFNRKLNYLRLSITEKCNLQCIYCMPGEGICPDSNQNEIPFNEYLKLCKILVNLGINRIRITGGEPLLRPGLPSFIKSLKNLSSNLSVYLTTNAILLDRFFEEAVSNNSFPDGINISLDALDPKKLSKINSQGLQGLNGLQDPEQIISQVDKLLEKNILVKINCVPITGYNDDELVPLAMLARDRKIDVRFIELMPIGSAANYKNILGMETAGKIEKALGHLEFHKTDNNEAGPAIYYKLPGFKGRIGFINPISHVFCDTCNRLRLSSRGKLKLCLSSDNELDLIDLIRNGCTDNEIIDLIVEFVKNKPHHHDLFNNKNNVGMFKIGG